MAFVWKADRPLRTEEEVARIVHEVSLERGLDELASVLALMCIRQESAFWCPWNRKDPTSKNYPHDSESDDGRSVGYYQQQNKVPGENPTGPGENWWGPMAQRMDLKASTNEFLERLSAEYVHVRDPRAAGDHIQRVQGSGFPRAYDQHWTYCWSLLRRALDGTPTPVKPIEPPSVKPVPGVAPNPAWRGDPVWLPQVLRAFGVRVVEFQGWLERGHGDFGKITHVLWHHTGSIHETNEGIAFHPALGLAANMLVHEDGTCVLTGVGIAWHGGLGIYPGIPENSINQVSIGIECSYGPDRHGNYTIRWPDAQMNAMIAIGGAISWFLGETLPSRNQIAHKEWAGRDNPLGINKQGKPDPGNLDMNWFRARIAERAAAGPTGDGGFLMSLSDGEQREMLQLLRWAFAPEYGEFRKLFASRSPYRRDSKLLDTAVGFELNDDGMAHAKQVEDGAAAGIQADLDDLERVADGGGEPLQTPELTAYWRARAQRKLNEIRDKE